MSENLVVRMYNIRFGDAILVTVPDKDRPDDHPEDPDRCGQRRHGCRDRPGRQR